METIRYYKRPAYVVKVTPTVGFFFYRNSYNMTFNKNYRLAPSQNEHSLIAITEKQGQRTVDARELHRFLKVGYHFSDWVKIRIQEYRFIENEDFVVIQKTLNNSKGGRRSQRDYSLSLDMAKELAMVERNERGREARRYFIAVEKMARQLHSQSATTMALPTGLAERSLNDRRLLPYRDFLIGIGATTGGSAYRRKKRYPNHFVKLDKLWYITEELAQQIQLTMAAYRNRKPLDAMPAVLALDFGESMEGGVK